jgi:hypothetical protein
MAEWWPMLLFLGLLSGGMMFALFAGYVRIEAERAEAERVLEQDILPAREASSHFLLSSQPESERTPGGAEDPVVDRLQRYLIREQQEVARFVARPSARGLYRRSGRRVREANVVRYLEKEQAAAAAFVSDPSVEALYRDSSRSVWLT